jgi:hypothetical protein
MISMGLFLMQIIVISLQTKSVAVLNEDVWNVQSANSNISQASIIDIIQAPYETHSQLDIICADTRETLVNL